MQSRSMESTRVSLSKNQARRSRADSVRDAEGLLSSLGGANAWPQPFPGYAGVFTYEVDEEHFPDVQAGLGNGVYLWQLDIVGGTVEVFDDDSSSNSQGIRLQMKKLLLDLPEDASPAMQKQKRAYIIEEWVGNVDVRKKEFCVHCDGTSKPALENTIAFDGLPLSRPALAGSYQMQIDEDNMMVKAVHSSWVEFAKLQPEQATGYMLHIDGGSAITPMIRPAQDEGIEQTLRQVFYYLKDYTRFERDVFYDASLVQVSGIDTVQEIFRATVEMEIHYMVSREDVVRYVVDPENWAPSADVIPEMFTCVNPESPDSVSLQMQKPHLEMVEKSVWAVQKVTYSGTFREILELNNFPFDSQWLHVRFEVESSGGKMRHKTFGTSDRFADLQCNWMNGGFTLNAVDLAECVDSTSKLGKCRTTVFIACKVSRKSFGVCMRTMFVMFLVILASLCPFALEPVSGLSDRLSLIFTMMLTAAAYATVVADQLPSLGYLTFLDLYILVSFAFFVLEAVQACMVGIIGSVEGDGYVNLFAEPLLRSMGPVDFKELDKSCIKFNLVVILFLHVIAVIFVLCFAMPAELRKAIDNPAGDVEEETPATDSVFWRHLPTGMLSDDDDKNDDGGMHRPLVAGGSSSCSSWMDATLCGARARLPSPQSSRVIGQPPQGNSRMSSSTRAR
mmetsp:Transcript_160183/g.292520  ORF Transcript_160183/g.292520 Transcript_160183/m.292520 type:complete len:675 (-) Transcript_160183:166-2190(-)